MLFVPACRALARSPLLSQARTLSTNSAGVPSLLTLADLSLDEIEGVLQRSAQFKRTMKRTAMGVCDIERSLERKTIAILFSKRSTRTRVASESSVAALGGHGMFLAPSDIQLGVNESLPDTARVVSSMVDGIMARVGGHHEVEGLASESAVPVINALSSRFHPTQILADLLTMLELHGAENEGLASLQSLQGKKVAWVGDSNNILNDMIVTYPRMGMHLSIAAPQGPAYERDPVVWDLMEKGLAQLPKQHTAGHIEWSHDPQQAVKDADFIVTDTWYVTVTDLRISMGDEAQKDQRLRDFQGFQVTEQLARQGGAKPDWKFLHCLPRKAEEVSDDVFYGPRSLVFPEAENRKWTIMACFESEGHVVVQQSRTPPPRTGHVCIAMSSFYELKAALPKNQIFDFSQLKGKVVLIVNTASKCGFTPQFEGLEKLYKEYQSRGFIVLGFPCNQFASQDPGDDDSIGSICQLVRGSALTQNYGVSFPIMAKSDVNGAHTNDVFTFLKQEKPGFLGFQAIKWNFTKFLIDREGKVVERYSPTTSPASIASAIEKLL